MDSSKTTIPEEDGLSVRSFFDFPTEIRMKVYENLYEEIHLSRSKLSGEKTHSTAQPGRNSGTSYIGLLLTSRRSYTEAKPYFDKARIVVSGYVEGILERHTPPHALQRITKLIAHKALYDIPANDGWPERRLLAFGFLNAALFSKLKAIRIEVPPVGVKDLDNMYSFFQNNLLNEIPAIQLQPWTSDEQYGKRKRKTSRDYAPVDPTYWFNNITTTDDAIRELDWTIRIPCRLTLRGFDAYAGRTEGYGYAKELFKEPFEITLIHSKNGVEFEDLPDFREREWWTNPEGFTEYTKSPTGSRNRLVILIGDSVGLHTHRITWYDKSWKASKPWRQRDGGLYGESEIFRDLQLGRGNSWNPDEW